VKTTTKTKKIPIRPNGIRHWIKFYRAMKLLIAQF
jgi:hypothetical protein